MKIRYTTPSRQLVFEADVANPKEAFEWLSTVQELFEEPSCGLCGKDHLTYEVREFDGNNYYKLLCRDCHATLDFGQRRDGTNLFIKRKDADGNPLPNRGWYRYQGGGAKPAAVSQDERRREPPRRPANNNDAPRREPVPF